MQPYQSKTIDSKMSLEALNQAFEGKENLPKANVISELCDGLMEVCPFKN